jgi:hypothetical protein
VIDRNTPVPIEQTRSFTTLEDFQESVRIRVYQGESRSAEENELLGQFSFTGFRRAPRGEVRIEVTFEIDTDGIVNVTAHDPETGQQTSAQISLSSGLSQAQLQAIIAEGKTDRVRSEAPGAAAPGSRGRPGARSGAAAQAPASAPDELEVLPDDAFDLEVDEDFEVVPGHEMVAETTRVPEPAPGATEPEATFDLVPEGTDLRDLAGDDPGPAGARTPDAPGGSDLFGEMDDLSGPSDDESS